MPVVVVRVTKYVFGRYKIAGRLLVATASGIVELQWPLQFALSSIALSIIDYGYTCQLLRPQDVPYQRLVYEVTAVRDVNYC